MHRTMTAWRTGAPCVVLCALALVACADGAPGDDAGAVPVDDEGMRYFAAEVVSLTVGEGGGFRADEAEVVLTGPPEGAGPSSGSLHVVSLGHLGEVILRLGIDVADAEGPDFIVFENAFKVGVRTFAEPGEVAVSDDGVTWHVFDCLADSTEPNGCAGYAPVLSHPTNDIDPRNAALAGGDAYDLAQIGISRARYVRIVDRSERAGDASLTTGGFDLDAVAVVHAHTD